MVPVNESDQLAPVEAVLPRVGLADGARHSDEVRDPDAEWARLDQDFEERRCVGKQSG